MFSPRTRRNIDDATEVLSASSGCLLIFGFLGSILVLGSFLYAQLSGTSDALAPGTNGILITLGIAAAMSAWQYRDLKKMFSGEGTQFQKYVLAAAAALGILFGIYTLVVQILYYSLGAPTEGWFVENWPGIWPPKPFSGAFTKTIETVFNSLFVAGAWVGLFVIVFLMGKFTSGLAIAAALHNHLNGAGFDFSAFYDLILNTTIPDIVGFIVTLGSLAFSIFLNRKIPNVITGD